MKEPAHDHTDSMPRGDTGLQEGAPLVLRVLDTRHVPSGGVELFRYDCEVLQHIASDHFLPIVEMVGLDGRLLLVLRDVGVLPLRDVMGPRLPLSTAEAVSVARRIAVALQEIHANNISYKTLCPETVYVGSDLAALRLGPPLPPFSVDEPGTLPAPARAMLPYLAPEQVRRTTSINHYRSDFYSLGILLFELLTGAPPVPVGDDFAVIRAHGKGLPLEEVRKAELPPYLRAVLERLLAPEADARYQSAAGVIRDLGECERLAAGGQDAAEFAAGAEDTAARPAGLLPAHGGDDELETLRGVFGRVADGGGAEVVLLAGEPGTGKTSLVLRALGDYEDRLQVITAALLPGDAGNPHTAIERLTAALQEHGQHSTAVRRAGTQDAESRGVASVQKEEDDCDDDIPVVPEEVRETLRLGNALAAPAAARPTVLIVDNIQYAPERLIAALTSSLRRNAHRRLVCVAVAGATLSSSLLPEYFRLLAHDGIPVHVLTMSPLAPAHIQAMIADTFGETLDDTLLLAELVHRRTGGNPQAVRAFLDELVSSRVLYFAYGRWQYDVNRLRELHAVNDPSRVLAGVGRDIPYRAFNELFTALAVHDIVDRVTVRELKREIRELRRRARRNKEFVEEVQNFVAKIARSMPELLFLFDIVRWKEIYANHNVLHMLGYTADGAGEERVTVARLVHPDDKDVFTTAVERLRTACDREVVDGEFRLKAADGSWQWFSAWSTVFNRTADGSAQCILGVARNITPRKEAQAALAESEERLSTIYNSVSDGILLVAVGDGDAAEPQYLVATVNQAFLRLSGLAEEHLVGCDLRQVFGPQLYARFVSYCSKAVSQRQPVYYEQEIELPRGRRIFETTLTPIFDRNGRCTHVLISGHDITRRMRAEERILAKYRENRQLMKEIDAQKNALMNAIVETQEEERRRIALDLHDSLAQTLSIAKLNFSSFEMAADGINTEQRHLLHTSIGLLDSALRELSLISYNLMPNTLHAFGLIAALEDMFHMINRVSTVKLSFHTHDYRRLTHQTEIILYRIIQELVGNAYKHSGASEISVQLVMHHRRLVAVVDDNGSGFEVQGALGEGYNSLGLKSVETRVKFLNGSMSVDSHENSGTVVAVEIPLTSASFADDSD